MKSAATVFQKPSSQVGLTRASCCDGLNYGVYGLRGLLPPCSPAGFSGRWPSLAASTAQQRPQLQFSPDSSAEDEE